MAEKLAIVFSIIVGWGMWGIMLPHLDPVAEKLNKFGELEPTWIFRPLACIAVAFFCALPMILTLGVASIFGLSAFELFRDSGE